MSTQLYKWVFTINDPQMWIESPSYLGQDGHLTPSLLTKLLVEGLHAKDWIFQLERGETSNRLHYQGCFILKRKQRKRELLQTIKAALFKFLHGHESPDLVAMLYKNWTVEPMMGAKSEAFEYCEKSETAVMGPWSKADESIYKGQDLPSRDSFYPYQDQIVHELVKQIKFPTYDSRSVNWVVDCIGNTGKSSLVKYLLWKYGEHVMLVPRGNAQNMRTVIINRGPAKLYLFDLPRTSGSQEHIEDVYAVIEDVKNGTVLSAMYGKDQMLLMDPPLVWVLSNYSPDFRALSLDRWVLWHMCHDKTLMMKEEI